MMDNEKWKAILSDIPDAPPQEEPERQYYFIKKARMYVRQDGAGVKTSSDLFRENLRLSDERQGF